MRDAGEAAEGGAVVLRAGRYCAAACLTWTELSLPDRYLCRNTTSMFLPLCLPKPPKRCSAGAFVLLLAWEGRWGEVKRR